MRKDRTEAACHTTLRQFPYFAVPMIIGLAAVYALMPPYWFNYPWHFIKAVAWITGIQFVIGNMWMVPRSIFRPPSEDRIRDIMKNDVLHFTQSRLIQSMLDEATKQGRPGMYHLRPSNNLHCLYKFCGFGTYAFSGWPSSRKALFLAAGRPDCVLIINPRDVETRILARKIDAAILLDGGYTGPAKVMMLHELEDQIFAAA